MYTKLFMMKPPIFIIILLVTGFCIAQWAVPAYYSSSSPSEVVPLIAEQTQAEGNYELRNATE